MLSAQGNRKDSLNASQHLEQRISVTADETRKHQNLFTSEEMENMKLNNLRHKRRQLQDKLKMVSNRINFKRKKEEQQLKRFIRSQEKSIGLIQTHNYKKFNEMMKDEFSQKKNFQIRKKAKQVQDFRVSTNRRLSLIYQTVKDRKIEESEKVRHLKKMDDQMLKYSKEMAFVQKKQQHQAISKMKERQTTKKKCYWFEKKMTFQQKMFQQAQIYQKQIEDYYKKIQGLKESEQKLKEQQQQATELLKCAQQNYQLLRQS